MPVKEEPGLVTPDSMDDDAMSRPTTRAKRSGEYLSRSRMLTPASSERSTPSKRQVLDHIAVPTRRSKLSTEKTNSADNLTLNSRLRAAVKVEVKDEAEEESGDTTESDPNRPTSNTYAGDTETETDAKPATRRQRAPANYAESSDEEKPLATGRRTRAARKGTTATAAISISSGSDQDDADYAMNSDDEVTQLHRAIQASKTETSRTRTSRASSSRSASASSTKSTPTKKAGKSATPHRAAIARAAQRMSFL